jgi:hypothetical protein
MNRVSGRITARSSPRRQVPRPGRRSHGRGQSGSSRAPPPRFDCSYQ